MSRRKKPLGFDREGDYLVIEKGRSYIGVDGCKYTPQSYLYAKETEKCAIFEKVEVANNHFAISHVIMKQSEIKKALGISSEERIIIQ